MKKVVAIVGARSGSKGVKDKNIKEILGKPLISLIIKTAIASKKINRVIVSTDSKHYAETAIKYGAEAPFIRPNKISKDFSPEIEYIKHALNWLKLNENYIPDIVVRLFPTVPFQKPEDIDLCVEKLLNNPNAESSVVISKSRQHPLKALKIIEDKNGKRLVSYLTESGRDVTPIARQNYKPAYFRSNIIVSRVNTIINKNSLTGDIVDFHEIPQERSLDIDSEFDFLIAEKIYKYIKENY
tara:strand:+ start:1208 stop:1930 length:723 start_codon:yes stop_codon:yes gene_type:complete